MSFMTMCVLFNEETHSNIIRSASFVNPQTRTLDFLCASIDSRLLQNTFHCFDHYFKAY